jgi:hypothetical protein
MKKFNFEYYLDDEKGDKILHKDTIYAESITEAKRVINAQISNKSVRTLFDWFNIKENNYVGVKFYC